MALKLPFYIAITDILLFTTFSINQYYVIAFGETLKGFGCATLGWTMNLSFHFNTTLVFIIAVVTYFRVARSMPISFGNYDWRLIAAVVSISVLTSVPAL